MHCVVMNASHEPLSVVPAERALVMIMDGRAVLHTEHPTRTFRTVKTEYPIPTAVILKEYRKTGSKYYGQAPLNQRNLFTRDDHRCVYCERHVFQLKASEYLTRDHVHPQSRGGKDEWINVVTACSSCNHRKDDRTKDDILMQVQILGDQLDEAVERGDKSTIKRLEPVLAALVPLARDVRPKAPTVADIMLARMNQRRGP